MALIRNKVTGELIKCTEFEAEILTCPQAFKDHITALMTERRAYLMDLGRLNMDIASQAIMFQLQDATITVKVQDVLNGEFELIPDTEASRVLYGQKV